MARQRRLTALSYFLLLSGFIEFVRLLFALLILILFAIMA